MQTIVEGKHFFKVSLFHFSVMLQNYPFPKSQFGALCMKSLDKCVFPGPLPSDP